ncbi:MAG: hypothetical protein R3F05_18020 [Planctomycetota bacterium]
MCRYLVLTVCLLLASCGGGSGGGGSTGLSTLQGTYWVVSLGATTNPSDATTTWGTMVADGAGTISPSTISNDDTSVSPDLSTDFNYEVDGNGEIRLVAGALVVYRGRISDDGRYAVLSALTLPSVVVLVRREGAHNVAGLTGPYEFAGAGFAAGPAAYYMSATFDGAGGYAGTGAVNEAGSFDGGTIGGLYSVTSSGAVTTDVLGLPFIGGVSSDDNFMLLGGGTTNGNNPLAWFLVRRAGAGGANSLLSGTYYACGVETVLGITDEAQSFWGVVRADGSGGFTMQGQTTGAGGVAPLSIAGTYSVAASGALTFDRAGLGENLSGGVSPDGRVAIASGGTVLNSNPVVIVMFRR